jgi:hypothetical protein
MADDGVENPFKMSPDEIAMWMSKGNAQPGSIRYEEARAAMQWELAAQARREAKMGRRWVVVAALGSAIAAVGSLIAAVAALD